MKTHTTLYHPAIDCKDVTHEKEASPQEVGLRTLLARHHSSLDATYLEGGGPAGGAGLSPEHAEQHPAT